MNKIITSKIYVADSETGTFIEEVKNIESGLKKIKEFEESDKEDGIYEPDFYELVDEDHCSLNS